MRGKFYVGVIRAWWRGLRCGNCLRTRSLGWWRNAWDKHTESYFCAECMGDRVATAEGELSCAAPPTSQEEEKP